MTIHCTRNAAFETTKSVSHTSTHYSMTFCVRRMGKIRHLRLHTAVKHSLQLRIARFPGGSVTKTATNCHRYLLVVISTLLRGHVRIHLPLDLSRISTATFQLRQIPRVLGTV